MNNCPQVIRRSRCFGVRAFALLIGVIFVMHLASLQTFQKSYRGMYERLFVLGPLASDVNATVDFSEANIDDKNVTLKFANSANREMISSAFDEGVDEETVYMKDFSERIGGLKHESISDMQGLRASISPTRVQTGQKRNVSTSSLTVLPAKTTSQATTRSIDSSWKSYLFHSVKDIETFVQSENKISEYLLATARNKYIFNCSNIHELKLDRKLGQGNFKFTFNGTFRGQAVAVKMPRSNFAGLEKCVNTMFGKLESQSEDQVATLMNALFTKCQKWSISNMLREIINHAVFNYPNVARLLGYCVIYTPRDDVDKNIKQPGIVSVYEYGSDLNIDILKTLPWQQRVNLCRELANLFEMFQFSILGSVVYYDFRLRHFKMIDDRITIIDMDDWVSPVEPKCGIKSKIPPKLLTLKRIRDAYNQKCQFGIECVNFTCSGVNAKFNIRRFSDFFLTPLISKGSLPAFVNNKYRYFLNGIQKYTFSAREIKDWLDQMINDFDHSPNILQKDIEYSNSINY